MSSPYEPSPSGTPAADKPDPTVDELQADLAATRGRLAASVEALAAKADVKGQAKAKATETADQVRSGAHHALDRAKHLPPAVLAGIAAAAVVLVVLLVRRGRRGA